MSEVVNLGIPKQHLRKVGYFLQKRKHRSGNHLFNKITVELCYLDQM